MKQNAAKAKASHNSGSAFEGEEAKAIHLEDDAKLDSSPEKSSGEKDPALDLEVQKTSEAENLEAIKDVWLGNFFEVMDRLGSLVD